MKTEQLIDCEGITLESNKPFAFSCCDCGLTHHMIIVSEDGRPVGFAVKRITPAPEQAAPVSVVGTNIAPEHYQQLSDLSDEAVERFKADAVDGPRYRWLRDETGILDEIFSSDVDAVIDAAILSTASPAGEGEVKS